MEDCLVGFPSAKLTGTEMQVIEVKRIYAYTRFRDLQSGVVKSQRPQHPLIQSGGESDVVQSCCVKPYR